MRNPSIHGWIGGPGGSPTEYGLPLDDSYLYEGQEEEGEDPEPQPCACGGAGWIGCECLGRPGELGAEELEDRLFLEPDMEPAAAGGDDWTPVKLEDRDDAGTFREVLAGILPGGMGRDQAL